jgi:hypothetical protein
MKKQILATALALAAAVSAVGCGAQDSGSKDDDAKVSAAASKEYSAEEIVNETLAKISDTSTLDATAFYDGEVFKSYAKKLYAMEYEELSDGAIAYDSTGGTADEISVIQPADGDLDNAVGALEARKQLRINDFTGYKPEELDKIEDARIFTCGGRAIFIISDNADEIENAVKSLF